MSNVTLIITKVLLEHGAMVDGCDGEGRTALRAACHNGHHSVVDVLLKYRADINKLDCEHRCAFNFFFFFFEAYRNTLRDNAVLLEREHFRLNMGKRYFLKCSTPSNAALSRKVLRYIAFASIQYFV